MSSDYKQINKHFFKSWVFITFGGYILGFVLTMVGLIAGDLISENWITMPEFQVVVGISMGAGVGLAQRRIVGKYIGVGKQWVWTSIIGLGLSFLLFDFISIVFKETTLNWDFLPFALIFGGLLIGVFQLRMLRVHSKRAIWWIPACIVGWFLAGLMSNVTFTGEWDAILNLGMILSGGVVLGIVTGGMLVWILRSSQSSTL